MTKTLEVVLHDGATIAAEVTGTGPVLLMPVDPRPVEGERAEELRRWGTDPALGRSLVDGLADAFTVVAFDYEGHVLAVPKPDTLTPANVAADLLAVADAAGAARFAYYGYSWTALGGLQLAARTDRLTALAMGGWPPLGAPYAAMLRVTAATHAMAVANAARPPAPPAASTGEADWSTAEVTLSPGQTRQFVTLYEALQTFDERATLARLACPGLCLIGAADAIAYDERWGGVRVDLAAPVLEHRAELASLGWRVHVPAGLDHMGAMQAATVLPILRPWLAESMR
ncbi:alpha/beta fold hydrolase [Dactylosporangium sp. CA-233914]|uniref:alpha/beta fold hydrolase n=1 Tax=Dactylosporangium sp. CA-233914 TaxID=3239934 RepID=UPI003D91B42B